MREGDFDAYWSDDEIMLESQIKVRNETRQNLLKNQFFPFVIIREKICISVGLRKSLKMRKLKKNQCFPFVSC